MFPINGSAINSAGASSLIQAEATLVNTAAISSVVIHIHAAEVVLTTPGVSVVANATSNSPGISTIWGTTYVQAKGLQKHTGISVLVGQVSISSNGVTIVPVSANITGSCIVLADNTDTDGNATISGNTSITAQGRLTLPGNANLSTSGQVTLSIVPVVTRNVAADIQGIGNFRAETTLQDPPGDPIQETYADIVGTSSIAIDDLNSVFKLPYADLSCTSDIDVTATQVQPGNVNLIGSTDVLVTNLYFSVLPVVAINSSADISIIPKVTQFAQANISCSAATLNILPSQEHSTVLDLSCYATFDIESSHTKAGRVNITSVSTLTSVSPVVLQKGVVTINGASSMSVTGEQKNVLVFPFTALSAEAEIAANGVIIRQAIVSISGGATIYSATITNPTSIDPPHRTLVKEAYDTELLRVSYDTEFRRSA